jgi:hypothetical protein
MDVLVLVTETAMEGLYKKHIHHAQAYVHEYYEYFYELLVFSMQRIYFKPQICRQDTRLRESSMALCACI